MSKSLNKIILVGAFILFASCSSVNKENNQQNNPNNKAIAKQDDLENQEISKLELSRASAVKFINSRIIPEKYSKLGAVKLLKNVDLNIDEDNVKITNYFQIIKIQNYEGKKNYADQIINYNKKTQKLILNDMYTVTQDGKTVSIPKHQSIEQDDKLTVASPQYVFHKDRIINFPNVEPGMSIVMDYTIIEKSDRKAGDYQLLDSTIPILKSIFTINYPTSFKLKKEKIGDDFTTSERTVNGKRRVIFTKRHSDPLNLENNTPYGLSINKDKIIYTFYKNWNEVGKKLENLDVEPTKEITDLSNKIIEDYRLKENKNLNKNLNNKELTKDEKVEALYSYILNNITTKATYISESDFKVGDLSKVIYQKYGKTEEVNALFIGLLKAQGITDVEPIAKLEKENRGSKYQNEYPMNSYITRLGVKIGDKIVQTDNEYDYLDVYDTKFNYISKKNNYIPVTYSPKKIYQTDKVTTMNITGNTATSETTKTLSGEYDFDLREYKNLTNKERQTYFAQNVGSASKILVGEPKFSDFEDYSKPMSVQYALTNSNYIVNQGQYKYFSLPAFTTGLSLSLDKRNYDYQIRSLISKRQVFKINLSEIGDGTKEYKMINNLDEKGEFKFGNETATYKINSQMEGKILTITKEIYIPSGIVKKEDYSKFKEIILKIQNPVFNKVFLEEVN